MDCGPGVQACPGKQLPNHSHIIRSIETRCGIADPGFRETRGHEATGDWIGKMVNPVCFKGLRIASARL